LQTTVNTINTNINTLLTLANEIWTKVQTL